MLFAQLSIRTWRRYGLRLLTPPILLLTPLFLTYPASTWNAIGRQLNFVGIHPTPLASLAQRVGPDVIVAGPVRLVAVVVIVTVVLARRRHRSLQWSLLVCGVGLLARQLSEPVMVPYYLAPGVAVLAIMLVCAEPTRALLGFVAATASLGLASLHLSPWPYFLMVALASGLVVFGAWPVYQAGEAEVAPLARDENGERRQPGGA